VNVFLFIVSFLLTERNPFSVFSSPYFDGSFFGAFVILRTCLSKNGLLTAGGGMKRASAWFVDPSHIKKQT